MTPVPLVSLQSVSYFYPGASEPALLNVDLALAPGEIVGLIGATGAGKTTLCLALNGIVPQFQGGRFFGSVGVAGLDTVSHPIRDLARHVGLVFQDPATQLVTSSVENEVAFTLENLSVQPAEIRRRVDEALVAVGLAEAARKHPHDLSGGQQQRLALAAALALRPPLIVLDEPTSQLDPESTAGIFQLVRDLNRSAGISFVITGQAVEELAGTAHRIVVLSRGRIAAEGTPEEVFRQSELLAREHLRAPEVTEFFSLLAGRGLFDRPAPVTLPAALRDLAGLPPARPLALRPPPPAEKGIPILELRDVTHSYPDGTAALRGVSLAIGRRDYVVLLGQNGAGKSTLLRHLLGLLRPTAGEVRLDGVSLDRHSPGELAQRIGYVPQNPDRHLFHATVEAELVFALQKLPLSPEARLARIETVLDELNLTRQRRAHPFTLAKGDRARVAMAAVLVRQPEVLIFDEPTVGQDDAGAQAILELTRRQHARGRTIIVVTHHLHLMPGYAERAVVLGLGRVLLDAPLREAYHAVDVLAQTRLRPTQAVTLARAARPPNLSLTPAELAGTFSLAP